MNTEVTDWQPIVKKNREATQVDFSENPDSQFKNLDNKFQSKQFTDISIIREINEAEKELQNEQFEKLENTKNELSESAKNALLKNKHVLLYQELKAKRLKKIKSKLFRRIKKKARQREEDKTLHMKISNNKEALLEEIEKMERQRAEVY